MTNCNKFKSNKRYGNVLFALDEIALKGGQDEDDAIVTIKDEKDITFQEGRLSRGGVTVEPIVIEPFSQARYDEKKATMVQPEHNLWKDVDAKGNDVMKYYDYHSISEVASTIFSELCDAHDVCDDYGLSEKAWECIQDSEEWKDAEDQVARQQSAYKIAKELDIELM